MRLVIIITVMINFWFKFSESFWEHIWLSLNKAQEVLWFIFVKLFFHNLDFIHVMEFGMKEWTKGMFHKISDASEAVGSSSSLDSDMLFAFVWFFSIFLFPYTNFLIAW